MKKSVNKFAVALWVLAAIVLLSEAASYRALSDSMKEMASFGGRLYVIEGVIWNALRMGLLSSAQLAGLGVIIELVDQIRWNALHRKN